MNIYTLFSIVLLWVGGLAFAYKFAEAGYPLLAFFVLVILGSIRMRWDDEKKDEETEEE